MQNRDPDFAATPSKNPGGEVSKRLDHLDSLRGIAALAVSFHHSVFAIAGVSFSDSTYPLFGQTPVVCFFLLSGFVLSCSLMKQGALTAGGIAGYYIRRIFRLYPVAVISLIFSAFAAYFYVSPNEGTPTSDWMKTIITDAHGVSGLKGYCRETFLLGLSFTHPVWTIRIELVASLLLPLVIVALKRYDWLNIAFGMMLVLVCAKAWGADFHNGVFLHFTGYFLAFYLGYLTCLIRPSLSLLSVSATKSLLLLFAILWILNAHKVFHVIPDTLILAGTLMVLVPCNWPRLKRSLGRAPLHFLGHISFSFYLIHWPVLILTWSVMAHYCTGFVSHVPHGILALILFLVSVAIAIPLSGLSECFIERPFNHLGHRLSKKLFPSIPERGESLGAP